MPLSTREREKLFLLPAFEKADKTKARDLKLKIRFHRTIKYEYW